MKKLHLLFLSFICLCCSLAFADSSYNTTMTKNCKTPTNVQRQKMYYYYNKAQNQNCQKPVEKQCETPQASCEKFLCTCADMNTLFKNMCLSETQICNAQKINDKYKQEVLSLCERIDCENAKYRQLEQNCAKKSELRKQKRLIKKLEKKKKEICECYEKQFKVTLSKDQKKAYNKYKKQD